MTTWGSRGEKPGDAMNHRKPLLNEYLTTSQMRVPKIFFFWMLTLIPTTMKRPCFFLFRLILALLANCSSCFSPPIFCPNRTAFLNPNERFARWRFSREPSDFCLAWKRTAKIPLLFGSWKALKQKHNQ